MAAGPQQCRVVYLISPQGVKRGRPNGLGGRSAFWPKQAKSAAIKLRSDSMLPGRWCEQPYRSAI
jgi:hypothetical protein